MTYKNPVKAAEARRRWRSAHPDAEKESQARYRRAYPDRVAAGRRRMALKRYGLDLDGYQIIGDVQDWRCAICRTTSPGGKGGFKIDHDHYTGKVRGLLCNRCNLALGHCDDDPNRLRAAANYLEGNK